MPGDPRCLIGCVNVLLVCVTIAHRPVCESQCVPGSLLLSNQCYSRDIRRARGLTGGISALYLL